MCYYLDQFFTHSPFNYSRIYYSYTGVSNKQKAAHSVDWDNKNDA